MRRFWANILIGFSALFIIASSFANIFININTNNEYANGREIVFQLTDKVDKSAPIEDDAAQSMADIMAQRLDKMGVTAYTLKIASNDIIKLTLTDNNDVTRNNVVNYLSFNGSLGLSNMDDNDQYLAITQKEDKFLLDGSQTYLDDINQYPTIVIPVNKNSAMLNTLIENTKTQHENGVGEETESEESESESEEKTVTTYLYLWYDFDKDNDTYSKTVSTSEDYDENVARKIIMKFNIENLWYPDDKENKLSATLNLDTDGDGSITYKEVRDGWDNARYYVNLLNSSELDYEVTYINDQYDIYTPATTEVLINKGTNAYIAMSRTFIATLVAVIVISLILVAFFRIAALAIGVTTLLTSFSATAFLVAIGSEFNVAALVAIILVTVASLACGIIYACKLKDEAYKGRTLKKANSEAAKRSNLPILDISIALFAIGGFTYLLGGTLMKSFALVTVLGALCVLLFNLIVLRIMMWLPTNTTALTGKYAMFDIEPDKVPALGSEEKQSYFGPFDKKDFTKHKKPIGIVTAVLFLAGLGGLISTACLNNGQYFKTVDNTQTSEIYITTTNQESIISTNNFIKEKILEYTVIIENDKETKLSDIYKDIVTYTHSETEAKVEVKTSYFVISFNKVINADMDAKYSTLGGSQGTLDEVLHDVVTNYDSLADASTKISTNYTYAKAHASGIMLGTVVAGLFMGIYFMIRYRLSRGIMATIAPLFVCAITCGVTALLTLANVSIASSVVLCIPFMAVLTEIITIMWMNKERDIIADEKVRDNSISNRQAIMLKNNSLAFASIALVALIGVFLMIDFFGIGPGATAPLFIVLFAGIIVLTILVANLFGPCSHFIFKKLANVNIEVKPKKAKKTGNIKGTKKGSEPEEAIFIGIND